LTSWLLRFDIGTGLDPPAGQIQAESSCSAFATFVSVCTLYPILASSDSGGSDIDALAVSSGARAALSDILSEVVGSSTGSSPAGLDAHRQHVPVPSALRLLRIAYYGLPNFFL
jgi:hypothetical protein